MEITFYQLSEWSSVLGFAISIVTLILAGSIKKAVNKERKTLIFTFRIVEHSESLKKACTKFVEDYDKIESPNTIKERLYLIKTTLELFKNISPPQVKSDIKNILKKIEKYYKCDDYVAIKTTNEQVTTNELHTIYTETQGIILKIDEIINTKGYGY